MRHLYRMMIEQRYFNGHIMRGIEISGDELVDSILKSSEEQLKNETVFLIVTSDRKGALSSSHVEKKEVNPGEFYNMIYITGLSGEERDIWKSNFESRMSTGKLDEVYATFIIYRHSVTNNQLAVIPLLIRFVEGDEAPLRSHGE